jgi:hypothetical protein
MHPTQVMQMLRAAVRVVIFSFFSFSSPLHPTQVMQMLRAAAAW